MRSIIDSASACFALFIPSIAVHNARRLATCGRAARTQVSQNAIVGQLHGPICSIARNSGWYYCVIQLAHNCVMYDYVFALIRISKILPNSYESDCEALYSGSNRLSDIVHVAGHKLRENTPRQLVQRNERRDRDASLELPLIASSVQRPYARISLPSRLMPNASDETTWNRAPRFQVSLRRLVGRQPIFYPSLAPLVRIEIATHNHSNTSVPLFPS